MKFHLATASGNVVTGLGPGWVRIGATDYRENLVLTPETIVTGWAPAGFDGLAAADFERLLAYKPEVVLLRHRSGDSLSAPAHDARLDRRAHRPRGDGHARRLPHVQHPRGGRSQRRRRVADGVSVAAAARRHWHTVPGLRDIWRMIDLRTFVRHLSSEKRDRFQGSDLRQTVASQGCCSRGRPGGR